MRKRAKFNLSNFHNCTFKMGYLYPVNLLEVLPGDSIQMSPSVFLRFAPMVAPVMHPTYMFLHHFYVPSRVLGAATTPKFDFEAFITGGQDGEDASTIPKISISASMNKGLVDAFGLPLFNLASGMSFSVNALPFIAYYLIWNEYYRDQDLDSPVNVAISALSSTSWGLPLRKVSWQKDYFTTARPWPQKGPDVTIPVEGTVDVTGTVDITPDNASPTFRYERTTGEDHPISETTFRLRTDATATSDEFPIDGAKTAFLEALDGASSGSAALRWGFPALNASFQAGSSQVSGISFDLQSFREAMAMQRFMEHRSLFGSRYEDYLRYLGVRPQDARLQMPEYLGGFSSPVQFSEVLQTAGDDAGGVGQMYGHGIAAAKGRRIRRFIPEHGYIMSLLCVRPIPVYAQGIERLWSKTTKYDFWTKELEHIGQQEVLNSEVYADGNTADGNTFGYQNRYDEYRRGVSVITGEFRTTQDYWTLARLFASRPALNSSFVSCSPSDRIFQVSASNSDQVYAMVKNNVIAKRLVSKNGNPI